MPCIPLVLLYCCMTFRLAEKSQMYLNLCTGTNVPSGNGAWGAAGIAAGNFDTDNNLDLITGNTSYGISISLFTGDGSGTTFTGNSTPDGTETVYPTEAGTA